MTSISKSPLPVLAGLVVATVAVFGPVYWVFVPDAASDFGLVAGYAQRLAGSGEIVSPHFLFPLLVVGIQRAVPILSFPEATWVAMTGIQAVSATVLLFVFRQTLLQRSGRSNLWAALLALAMLLLGPVNFFTLPAQNLHAGYFNSNNFHNPSSNMLKPLAVGLFFGFTASLRGWRPTHPWAVVIGLGTIQVAATLVKPSFAIYFLPAMLLVLVFAWRWKWHLDPALIIGAYLLPIVVVAASQYLVTYTPLHPGEAQRYVAVEPFRIALKSTPTIWIPIKLIASIAFPLAVLVAFFREARENPELLVAWTGFIVAAAYAYLLVEGIRGTDAWTDGNFWWSVQIATFLLFVVSIRHMLLVSELGETRRWVRAAGPRVWGCVLILAAQIVGGLLWYLATLLDVWVVWR